MYLTNINDLINLQAKKIAFFAGSFDPMHNGHLQVIKSILEKHVDHVVICPHSHNPQKKLIPMADRVTIINLSINVVR